MKNMKVSKKLFISYALILILLIAGCIVSIVDFTRLGEQIDDFYSGPFTVNSSAGVISAAFERMQKSVYRSLSNSDPAIVSESIQNAKNDAAAIEEQIPVIEEHFLGDGKIIVRLKDALIRLTPMREHVLMLAEEGRQVEAAAYMEKNNILVIKEAQEELDNLTASGKMKGEELVDGLRARRTKAIFTLIVLGNTSVIVSIVFGFYITRGITRPVNELERAARSMARGDLSDVRITYEAGDELGRLAEDMRSMAATLLDVIQDETRLLGEIAGGNFDARSRKEESYVGDFMKLLVSMKEISSSLSRTLLQINHSASEVASGSEQMANGAQMLAQGATEQTASVEELSCTANDISEQIGLNAGNAQEAGRMAQKVRSKAQESSQCMQDMLEAMADISRYSGEIGKIIKSIEEIAFQTNILALNAAVEAARAGTQGMGFSAVAKEVRNLANKAAAASKSTADLIESSVRSIETGRVKAHETAEVLSDAVRGIDSVAESLESIASATVKQSDAVRQITENINTISSVVQTNTATAEESAAASEELSSQALLLSGLVEQFRLKTDGKKG